MDILELALELSKQAKLNNTFVPPRQSMGTTYLVANNQMIAVKLPNKTAKFNEQDCRNFMQDVNRIARETRDARLAKESQKINS